MGDFPRTTIEHLSVSRMIIGTNWMLGFSHQTEAKNKLINSIQTAKAMADILEVFLKSGVDTLMAPLWMNRGGAHQRLADAMKDAQDRTGRKLILVGTPCLSLEGTPEADAENHRIMDEQMNLGVSICMPHTATTDALVDVRGRRIDRMDEFASMIRQREMIPGLSTHMPEAIIYADESGLDVGTYISLYNAAGFLMHVEIEWTRDVIHNAKRPVITIKPMAAGRITPLVGLTFSWNSIRPCDMVTVGTMTPDEAREVIDISQSILAGQAPVIALQTTRSKASLARKK